MKFRDLDNIPYPKTTVILFQSIIYIWALVAHLILLPGYWHFWGTSALHLPKDLSSSNWVYKLTHLLYMDSLIDLWWVFLLVQLVATLSFLVGKCRTLSAIAIFFSNTNLDHFAVFAGDGGTNFLDLALFFMIPLSFDPTRIDRDKSVLKFSYKWISLYAFFLIRLQICMVYFTAGLGKVHGELWTSGVAMYYVQNSKAFSNEIVGAIFAHSPFLTTVTTYTVVFFQLSFPFLIWFRQTRYIYLFIGTIMHLGIAFSMKLFTFGVTMTLAYFIFCTDKESIKIFRSLALDRFVKQ